MIIYVIIYHIINNKNFNIDICIKHNTIISTVYKHIVRQKEKKKIEYDIAIRVYI